jgi:tetratricopeptide (TPR) repeat protein
MPPDMPAFGREKEIQQLRRILEEKCGKAVLVSGPMGIGKSTLVETLIAECEPSKKQATPNTISLSFRFTRDLTTEQFIQMMLADIENAIETNAHFLSVTPRGRKQLSALADLVPKSEALKNLFSTLRDRNVRHPSAELIDFMRGLSRSLEKDQRVVIFVDADKTLNPSGVDTWRTIVQALPENVNLIFTQRPDDALLTDCDFMALRNVALVPSEGLGALSDSAVYALAEWASEKLEIPTSELLDALRIYKGYPYAVNAAIRLLGEGVKLADLPNDPRPTVIAPALWKQALQCHDGSAVSQLFKAYAILDRCVCDEAAIFVSDVNANVFQSVLASPLCEALIPKSACGRSIYHSIFQDYIRGQISSSESHEINARATRYYLSILESEQKTDQIPDPQASSRAFFHAFEAYGVNQATAIFVDKCVENLFDLGFLELISSTASNYLALVDQASDNRAELLINLGAVAFRRGQWDHAFAYDEEALEIFYSNHNEFGVACVLSNLGVVYSNQGDLSSAEEALREASEIHRRLGAFKALATDLTNLGILYFKQNDLIQALEVHSQSFQIHKENDGKKGVAMQLGNIGNVRLASGDLLGAESCFRDSLSIFSELGHHHSCAIQFGSLGAVMHYKKDLEKANEYFTKALATFREFGSKADIGRTLRSLGIVLFEMEKFSDAEEQFFSALEVNEQLGRVEGIVAVLNNLAECKESEGCSAEAKRFRLKAASISEEHHSQ